jgi:hypothetical protein
MDRTDREQERLRQLRERQLADRDPLIKQRQFQRNSAQRERRVRKPVTLAGMWREIPNAWKGFFYGVLLGTMILIILPLLWISPWAIPCAAISIVIFGIFGVVVGRAMDARDSINDLMR